MTAFDALKDIWVERQVFLARTIVACVVSLVLVAVLCARLVDLQVLDHQYYITRAEDNRIRLQVVPPVRGLVFDRHGTVLAQNVPSYQLEVTPEEVRDLPRTLDRLGRLVTVGATHLERFRDRMRKAPQFRGVALRTRLSI